MNSFIIFVTVLFIFGQAKAFTCPASSGLFPNPSSFNSFYECNAGVAYLQSCPSGLVYDAKKLLCDWPTNSPSAVQSVPSNNENESVNRGRWQQPPASNAVVHVDKGMKLNPISNQIEGFPCPLLNGMFQIEGNCNNFVHCERGLAFYKACPVGLNFNPISLVCDWPNNVRCVSNQAGNKFRIVKPHYLNPGSTATTPWQPPQEEIPWTHSTPGYIPPYSVTLRPNIPNRPTSPKNTNTGYEIPPPDPSVANQPSEITNFGENKPKFDTTSTTTAATISSTFTSSSSSNDEGTYECDWCFKCPKLQGYFENTFDPLTYYHCVNGKPFLMYCAKGLVFNVDADHCTKPGTPGALVDTTSLIQAREGPIKPKNPKN